VGVKDLSGLGGEGLVMAALPGGAMMERKH